MPTDNHTSTVAALPKLTDRRLAVPGHHELTVEVTICADGSHLAVDYRGPEQHILALGLVTSETLAPRPRTGGPRSRRIDIRGAAVRLTAVLLGEDDAALQQRVCANDRSVKDYTAAADWLQRESAYLRKVARLLDTAGGRVVTVPGRCKANAAAAP